MIIEFFLDEHGSFSIENHLGINMTYQYYMIHLLESKEFHNPFGQGQL